MDEDCRNEDFGLAAFDIRTAATLTTNHLRSSLPVADCVSQFEAIEMNKIIFVEKPKKNAGRKFHPRLAHGHRCPAISVDSFAR